jgi:hypothetical protein
LRRYSLGLDTYDPTLISLVRRIYPKLVAGEIVVNQPMTKVDPKLFFSIHYETRWEKFVRRWLGKWHRIVLCPRGKHVICHDILYGWICQHCRTLIPWKDVIASHKQ